MTPHRRAGTVAARTSCRKTQRLIALALALASFQCASSAASAGESAGPSSLDNTAAAAQPRPADVVHYRVVVDAPSEFVDTLNNSVDLVRWQSYADMTEDLFDRLTRDAVDQAREAVSTEGYFTP